MATENILIIEDEGEIREILTIHLEDAGYQVLEAENGQRAKEILEEGNNRATVDIIITDIRMPKVNGVEIIDYLKENVPGIPVIVVTAFPDKKLADQLIEEGVKKYLVKPVDRQVLLQAVAAVLS